MPPSTMRQITILQLGPTEVENLREGGALPLPISPEMGILFQQGRAELYVTIAGKHRISRSHTQITGQVLDTEKALPEKRKQLIIWTPEESMKVLLAYERIMGEKKATSIGKGLALAQEATLPANRHRQLSSIGNSHLNQIRQNAKKFKPHKPEKIYKCPVKSCKGTSSTAGGLAGHITGTHTIRERTNGNVSYSCKVCENFHKGTWKSLLGHLQNAHGM